MKNCTVWQGLKHFLQARLSNDNHWLASEHNIFFKMAACRIAIVSEHTGKFKHDSMQQKTKKQKSLITKNL